MSKKKLIWGVILVSLLAGGGFALYRMNQDDEGLIAIEMAPVSRQEVVEIVTATGRIQPKNQVNVSADISAKIVALTVEEGDLVERGQLLVELDRNRYEAAVESAEANLRAAEANTQLYEENVKKAAKDLDRIQQLFDRDLESRATLDSMTAASEVEKARHRSALEEVAQARAALKQSRDDYSKAAIHAPMDGTVSRLDKEVGEIALGSQFQEDVIMVIANLSGMEALVDVDENDIVAVSIGDTATIEVDALPDMTFTGEVTEIANSAKISDQGTSDQKTEFEVRIVIIDAGDQLRPGMTASTSIITDTRTETLAVPIQSVAVRTLEQLVKPGTADTQDSEDLSSSADDAERLTDRFTPDKEGFVEIVFVVDGPEGEHVVEARQVTTGIQGESHIEILSGLDEGESIVTGSYRAISRDLADGSKVTCDAKGEGKAS